MCSICGKIDFTGKAVPLEPLRSMANSLKVRVPFLDYTLVQYVFSLRGSAKPGACKGKRILLETFKDLIVFEHWYEKYIK